MSSRKMKIFCKHSKREKTGDSPAKPHISGLRNFNFLRVTVAHVMQQNCHVGS